MAWGHGDDLPGTDLNYEILLRPVFTSIVKAIEQKQSLSQIGSRFHRTLARIVGDVSHLISEKTGIKKVALSGGCYQNRLLLKMTVEELGKHGLHPLFHHNVPANDGGVSLGQAAIGHFMIK
jgi:hydrogenase maturation protein HypF